MECHDWKDRGLAEIRAVLAEAITAEFAYLKDPDATWLGGQRRGHDVVSAEGKRDAKSVRIDKAGYIILARRNAEPYDPERADRIMLLHLDATTAYSVNLDSGTAELAAKARILNAWDVPVTELNQLLPDHGDDDPTWRNVELDPSDLAEYKVL